ncbi:MAG: hypothetical protein IPH35_21800 [Rhodoferax sp.]|nr:hypothetical protein [Rhodoferax sp.]
MKLSFTARQFALGLLLPGLALAADTGQQPRLPELVRPDYLPAKPDGAFQLPPIATNALDAIDTSTDDDVLTPTDHITFLIRDKGVVLNLEYSYPLISNPGKGQNLAVTPFYDWGWGKNQREEADILAALGVALRLRQGGFKLDLALAHRQIAPASVSSDGGTLQDKGAHVQLS